MRKPFMSLIANDRYQIGCTGQTVYLLDASGNELAKFKDMPYAYDPAFHPSGEIAAVYGNTGMMAVYALSERRLIAKFRVSAASRRADRSRSLLFAGWKLSVPHRGSKRGSSQQPSFRLFDGGLSARAAAF